MRNTLVNGATTNRMEEDNIFGSMVVLQSIKCLRIDMMESGEIVKEKGLGHSIIIMGVNTMEDGRIIRGRVLEC